MVSTDKSGGKARARMEITVNNGAKDKSFCKETNPQDCRTYSSIRWGCPVLCADEAPTSKIYRGWEFGLQPRSRFNTLTYCVWRGHAPRCGTPMCDYGESMQGTSTDGDSGACWSGMKSLCCDQKNLFILHHWNRPVSACLPDGETPAQCHFPFYYKAEDKLYTECTTDGWHEPWCYTTSDHRSWGNCRACEGI